MKLEQQVCSLELAKRLKELGVRQDSLFYWVGLSTQPIHFELVYEQVEAESYKKIYSGTEVYSAFTVAELGEMLPDQIKNSKTRNLDSLIVIKTSEDWIVEYHTTFDPPLYGVRSKSEADARAKMLIYLIENKLQTISEEK